MRYSYVRDVSSAAWRAFNDKRTLQILALAGVVPRAKPPTTPTQHSEDLCFVTTILFLVALLVVVVLSSITVSYYLASCTTPKPPRTTTDTIMDVPTYPDIAHASNASAADHPPP